LANKPIIRWAGSKRKLLPILTENLPKSYTRYIEPFCGSACLFFEASPAKAILSDINLELINAFKEIKSNKHFRDELVEMPVSQKEYYRVRNLDVNDLSKKERAIRFMYLNRYCFNGVYRTNQGGHFNVPMGTKTGSFPPQSIFDETRRKLRKARLVSCDYKKTLEIVEKGDFAYIDPPYSKANKFTGEYGLGSFNSNELPLLFEQLSEIDSRKAKFLLSYRACAKSQRELSKNYNVISLSVKRHIAGFKTTWSDCNEILVKNYD
jgi:DNA adenine methylase